MQNTGITSSSLRIEVIRDSNLRVVRRHLYSANNTAQFFVNNSAQLPKVVQL